MKRKDLLKQSTGEHSQEVALKALITKDVKFVERKITALSFQIEDAEEKLSERMRADAPIDDSVIHLLYGDIVSLRSQKVLIEQFQKEWLSE
jgi:hypothetical protein